MSDRSAEIEEGRGHLCAIPHERRGCAMCERDQLKARVASLEALVDEALPLVGKVLRLETGGPSSARVLQLLEWWLSRAKASRK